MLLLLGVFFSEKGGKLQKMRNVINNDVLDIVDQYYIQNVRFHHNSKFEEEF